jgi:hypothetical protein
LALASADGTATIKSAAVQAASAAESLMLDFFGVKVSARD